MKLLLVSGPLAVGKSTIATELVDLYEFFRIRSGAYLSNLADRLKLDGSRFGLQCLGDKLDSETDYRWLITDVAEPTILAYPEVKYWLLDCVRKERQVTHFRNRCQTASKFDPASASNFDPLWRRVLAVAVAPSELVGVAETARARVGI
jgi:hypothetical protein